MNHRICQMANKTWRSYEKRREICTYCLCGVMSIQLLLPRSSYHSVSSSQVRLTQFTAPFRSTAAFGEVLSLETSWERGITGSVWRSAEPVHRPRSCLYLRTECVRCFVEKSTNMEPNRRTSQRGGAIDTRAVCDWRKRQNRTARKMSSWGVQVVWEKWDTWF